jgi:hypothetical protein
MSVKLFLFLLHSVNALITCHQHYNFNDHRSNNTLRFLDVLVPAIYPARLWRSHFNGFLLHIPPRLRCSTIVATFVNRLMYNTNLAILRLWRAHGSRLYALMTDIAFRHFSSNSFRTHAVSPRRHVLSRRSHFFVLRSVLHLHGAA